MKVDSKLFDRDDINYGFQHSNDSAWASEEQNKFQFAGAIIKKTNQILKTFQSINKPI